MWLDAFDFWIKEELGLNLHIKIEIKVSDQLPVSTCTLSFYVMLNRSKTCPVLTPSTFLYFTCKI